MKLASLFVLINVYLINSFSSKNRIASRFSTLKSCIRGNDGRISDGILSSGRIAKLLGITLASSISFLSPNIDFMASRAYADSRLNAPTSAGTRVNSDAESLLRYGLPISNKEIRDIQASIELTKMDLKTRRIPSAKQDVNNAKELLKRYESKLLAAVPSANVELAKASLERLKEDTAPLLSAIEAESNAGAGSLQERKGKEVLFTCIR